MSYQQHRCPNCGAPLPPPPPSGTVRCSFCASPLAVHSGTWRATAPSPEEEALLDPARPRLWVGSARYCVLGRIARGESSDVFFARRDSRLTELVVIKVLRAPADPGVLAREFAVLEQIPESSAPGTPHFSRLLPQPVACGPARLGMNGQEGERPVLVLRWRSGFVHTLEDVRAAYPGGVPPEHSIWLWKRMLEVLGWLHRAGWSHGAIVPPHLLVHARDHGVALVGWSRATAPAQGAADVAMSARAVLYALGDDPAVVPSELAELLRRNADPSSATDAWALKDQVDAVARTVFGPPKYIPFSLSR